jgi:hypothetical protein
MYNIKKRFGTIYMNNNMTKEIEETILNDEKQMQKLYERIEELEKINNEKDIEIKLLKEQNKIYLNIIRKNNLDIENKEEIFKSDKGPELLDFNKMKEALNKDVKSCIESGDDGIVSYKEKEINDLKINNNTSIDKNIKETNSSINIPTPSISSDSNKFDLNNIKNIKKKIIKILIISYYKYKCEKIMKNKENNKNEISSSNDMTEEQKNSTKLNNSTKKIRAERDKSLPILDRFKVKVYNDEDLKNSEILQFVGSEDCFMIEFQYKIADKINKKVEEVTIDDVINFKIKYEGLRNTYTRRTEFRRLITRCKILYEKHEKKLCKFKISLSHLKIMSDDEWEEWLIEFNKLVEEVSKEKLCKHKYKNGNICGKISCKIRHKPNI